MTTLHATCIAIDGHGILLRGLSGSGKSDLALRLIEGGAVLIGDDYCAYRTESDWNGDTLIACARPETAGLLEVRGIGLVRIGHAAEAPVRLLFDLIAGPLPERMPTPDAVDLFGVAVPRLYLNPFEASAAAKVRLAVRLVRGDITAVS